MSNKRNISMYVMYVYDCNAIMMEILHAFTELRTDLKNRGFNPGFHVMDNEASTALKKRMSTMGIKYELVPPCNHIANYSTRSIQKFNNHFISGL